MLMRVSNASRPSFPSMMPAAVRPTKYHVSKKLQLPGRHTHTIVMIKKMSINIRTLRTNRRHPILRVLILAGLITIVAVAINHHTTQAEQRYFTQLPAEVKADYIPQLSLFDNPAPAGLWETACYQQISASEGTSFPITCGVWAGEFINTNLTLQQARTQFQKLITTATSQGFSNTKTTYNYTPDGNSSTIDIHFSATGPDKNCIVTADYGSLLL